MRQDTATKDIGAHPVLGQLFAPGTKVTQAKLIEQQFCFDHIDTLVRRGELVRVNNTRPTYLVK
jgi:hypothetical protein